MTTSSLFGLSCWLSLAGALQAPSADLRRVAREAVLAPEGERALEDAFGRPVGAWTLGLEGARVRVDGRELELPRLQAWFASPDGKTLVGVGDEVAPEHPFELAVRVWREGEPAVAPSGRFDPESELVVGADGRVALVGQRAGERGRPLAVVLAAHGEPVEHALPEGTSAHDPVLVEDGLLVRVAPLPGSTARAALVRVDALGARTLRETPDALTLVALPGRDEVLVHERAALSRVEARSGEVLWRLPVALRPASERAWTLWNTPSGASVALVTAGLVRRGQRGPAPAQLELFDLETGQVRASVPLEPGGPPGSLGLRSAGATLVVEGLTAREVFAW
jgi:hypothetical protein